MPGSDRELRAVAPLVVAGTRHLVGPVTLISNGAKTIAVTSAELLRPHQGAKLAIATALDGSTCVPVVAWGLGRYAGIGLLELGGTIAPSAPGGPPPDVEPVGISAVCATVETRGAPAAIVVIEAATGGFRRTLIPVTVDAVTSGTLSTEVLTRLAIPIAHRGEAFDPARPGFPVEGAPVFSWFPRDAALGRKREVVVFALAYPYRARAFKPRPVPALAELVGLEDVGRALISHVEPDDRPELAQVAGEIEINSPIASQSP